MRLTQCLALSRDSKDKRSPTLGPWFPHQACHISSKEAWVAAYTRNALASSLLFQPSSFPPLPSRSQNKVGLSQKCLLGNWETNKGRLNSSDERWGTIIIGFQNLLAILGQTTQPKFPRIVCVYVFWFVLFCFLRSASYWIVLVFILIIMMC